jgi:hypothetical protein
MSDNQEGNSDPTEGNIAEDLHRQILELRRQLKISEETRERNLRKSVQERNYDEIRVLSKASGLFRNGDFSTQV